MKGEDKMLPDWLANMIMLKIPKELQNQFKEDILLKYENEIDRLTVKCNEYEEDISILQHNYNCKKLENEIMHKRLKLITNFMKLQGYTDAELNEIMKLTGE